jgi:hypothetical protein
MTWIIFPDFGFISISEGVGKSDQILDRDRSKSQFQSSFPSRTTLSPDAIRCCSAGFTTNANSPWLAYHESRSGFWGMWFVRLSHGDSAQFALGTRCLTIAAGTSPELFPASWWQLGNSLRSFPIDWNVVHRLFAITSVSWGFPFWPCEMTNTDRSDWWNAARKRHGKSWGLAMNVGLNSGWTTLNLLTDQTCVRTQEKWRSDSAWLHPRGTVACYVREGILSRSRRRFWIFGRWLKLGHDAGQRASQHMHGNDGSVVECQSISIGKLDPYSAELNIIETQYSSSLNELKAVLVDVWDNLFLVTINDLVAQVPAPVLQVIAEDGHTIHQLWRRKRFVGNGKDSDVLSSRHWFWKDIDRQWYVQQLNSSSEFVYISENIIVIQDSLDYVLKNLQLCFCSKILRHQCFMVHHSNYDWFTSWSFYTQLLRFARTCT